MERISFKIDGEIKIFLDKQKLREFSTTKPALQQMLKGLIQLRNTREEKDLQNQPQTIKKMAIGTYTSIITLNVNGLNAPTKRHRLAAAAVKSLQSCPTLCDPVDGSPRGSPVPGILQARTLEWVAISFSSA